MSEGVWVALITAALGPSGIIIILLTRQSRRVKSVKEHVENSHETAAGEPYNLRDNIDDNQEALLDEIRGMRKDLGRLDTRDIERGKEIRVLSNRVNEHLAWSAE